MLSEFNAFPTLPTADLNRARTFYEETLGLEPGEQIGPEENMGLLYTAGSTRFLVYPSEYSGTNKATYMGFEIPADKFSQVAEALREKGVTFETFDMPDAEWQDGILVGYGMKSAWFRDPDENILNIVSSG